VARLTESKVLEEEVRQLALRLFGDSEEKRAGFEKRLLDMYTKSEKSQFLIIHNPGGWGNTRIENLLQWERSIIEGVDNTIRKMGYSGVLVQYFRSSTGWRAVFSDVREQSRYFNFKAEVMAEEMMLLTRHLNKLKILMIGISQGAAFSNAVLQRMDGEERIFSIEIGTPFYYKSKSVATDRSLTLNGNGLMPDALMEYNVPVILKTYFTAPVRWLKYRIQGKKIKFTYCINVPGHDYNWDYPEVRGKIEEFLRTKFGQKSDVEVGTK